LGSFKRDINEGHPEKVVIVTGPTFGTAMEFMLLGAVIGAAAMYWQRQRGGTAAATDDAVFEGLTAGGAKGADGHGQLVERLTRLSHRLKNLAARTKETVQSAAEVMGPSIKQAVAEGKSVAHQTAHDLEEELHRPPSASTVTAPGGVVPEGSVPDGQVADGPTPGM
jgi:hypothetical protein